MFLRKRLQFFIPLLVCLTLTVFSVTGCSEKKSGSRPKFKRPVQVGTVITHDVPIYVDSFGYLSSLYSVDIKSQVTGKLATCNFTEGQYVKKGDTLYTLDSRMYKAILDASSASVLQAQADFEHKKFIVDKDKSLVKTSAIGLQVFKGYVTDMQMAEAEVDLQKATLQQNNINLAYCNITSPIDGVTGQRLIDAGNIVSANSGSTLVNIKTIDPLYVDFTIPEKNLFLIKESMKNHNLRVLIKLEEFNIEDNTSNFTYEGELQFVNNTVNNQTGTIFLRGLIPNKNRKLLPGQFVKVTLIFSIQKNILLAPYIAVQQGLKGYYTFEVQNNKAILHYVTPGLKQGDYIQIIDKNNSIKPGAKLVTVGQMGLAPGVGVRIIKDVKLKLPTLTVTSSLKNIKVGTE